VQRLGWGINIRPQTGRVGLVFAVENLTDAYYASSSSSRRPRAELHHGHSPEGVLTCDA